MAVTDAPDWERVAITVKATGDVPDAPDWQRIVVGSGGAPIVSTGLGVSFLSLYATAGFLGVTVDPMVITGSTTRSGGFIYGQAFQALATGNINNVWLALQAGAATTAASTFVAIYDFGATTANTFTRLGISAAGAATAQWSSAGTKAVALTAPVAVTQGTTYMAMYLTNGGTPTTWGISPAQAAATPLFTTFPWRIAFGGGTTAMPLTIAYSACTFPVQCPLMFVS